MTRSHIPLSLCLLFACSFAAQAAGHDVESTSSSGSSGSSGAGESISSTTVSSTTSGSSGLPMSGSGVAEGDAESGSTGGAGGTDEDTTGVEMTDGDATTGGWTCEINDQCAGDEVCAGQACVDAWQIPHALQVVSWDEPCDGAGTNTFFVRVGTADSEVVGCPQAWPEDWFTVGPGASVRLDFYEKGGAPNPDQLVTQWCWDSGMGCGPIPKSVLHTGGATVQWDGWAAEVVTEPL